MNYLGLLAKLNVGHAHPGGFSSTLNMLKNFPIGAGQNVLEVGCGTGQTACHLAKQGCKVTAVDIQPAMIKAAKQQAEKEGVTVRFHAADACKLPFRAQQFDVVLVESVTIFVHSLKALKQYYRVLKKNGRLFDREILTLRSVPNEASQQLNQLFGIQRIPDEKKWKQWLKRAGFHNIRLWDAKRFRDNRMDVHQQQTTQNIDWQTLRDPKVMETLQKYDRFMFNYSHLLGSGLFIGTKK